MGLILADAHVVAASRRAKNYENPVDAADAQLSSFEDLYLLSKCHFEPAAAAKHLEPGVSHPPPQIPSFGRIDIIHLHIKVAPA